MFKVGDMVRRTSGSHAGMFVGDVGTVVNVIGLMIRLKEFDGRGWHDGERFVKVNTFKGNK